MKNYRRLLLLQLPARGHSFRKCFKYECQKQEDLAFGSWVKAIAFVERFRQNRGDDKWNRSNSKRDEEPVNQEHHQIQQQDQRQANSDVENFGGAGRKRRYKKGKMEDQNETQELSLMSLDSKVQTS